MLISIFSLYLFKVFYRYFFTVSNPDMEFTYQGVFRLKKPYVVQINDNGEIEFIEVEDYTPKQYEFVLTPINL